jgi:hypothetical protein
MPVEHSPNKNKFNFHLSSADKTKESNGNKSIVSNNIVEQIPKVVKTTAITPVKTIKITL